MMFLHGCDSCGSDYNERVFRDSYTGMELCAECLHAVIGNVTMSPQDEGDNLRDLLSAAQQ